MQAGFLTLKTDASTEGIVLLSKSVDMPDLDAAGASSVFWVGRFRDMEAAQMHAHGYYCRQLVDIDQGSYKLSPGRAVAAIEGDKLLKETVYRGANFDTDDKEDLAQWQLYYKRRKQRFSWLILALKVIAISYLLFIFVMTF